jgi:serine/threonine protein kinase
LGEVYLVDFGSVQTLAAREGSTVTVVGTYGYMPPEQFGGRAVPASDLYGLGATLIYLVTGVHPAELPQEDLRINFEPKIAISSDFVDWLQWMTEPDLNSRLTSADRALKALERPIEAIPLVVRKPSRSKVKLKKDRNCLEIVVPSSYPLCLTIAYSVVVFFIIHYFFLGSISFIIPAFSMDSFLVRLSAEIAVFFWVFYFVYLSVPICLQFLLLYDATRLRLDRKEISLTSNWLGFVRYNLRPPSPRMAICKLRFIVDEPTESRPHPHRDIQIWAGTHEYKLITSHLTDGEIDWIAGELSEWLDLPISE